ncbi:Ribokinase-like protein [Macrolepiota fuliginosa MF-IS2]|uniref:Adenosine kinase n=1 Tax=Macrolepiota fuliginosa MF-IS2 TaxID=1400762 RepID=A0A9P5XCW6_9AGAR|nr:Ribokinase-like protein [Macrolepiota fuliginosa MF-IS2]
MAAPTYKLFCLGNPLLDMQVTNGEGLLAKYGLKANDAILAEEKHAPIYDELVKEHKVTYVAGGASQNAARGAAYILPPKSVVYTGCVGDDELAEQLKAANAREGLDEVYQVKKGDKTGACAVVITGHHRSLVTTLRVAEKFEQSHLESPKVLPLIEAAQVFYVEGYFLTHGTTIVEWLAKKSSAANKTFVLNLSAPFIAQFFTASVKQVLPYTDILIANESEAEAWATATNFPGSKTDLTGIAKAIVSYEKANPTRERIVIFTQGAKETHLVAGPKAEAKIFPVTALKDEEIVDTNGAGDAFAGGFLGAYVAGKSVEESVLVGHKLGGMCVGQVGPQYKWPKVQVL